MVVVSLFKGVLFAGLARLFRYGNVVPLAVGFGLFQVGEFSFVLARVGVATDSISSELFSLVLATAVVTMVLTPIVSGQTARFYAFRKRRAPFEPLETRNLPDAGLRDHVVIAGKGRVGTRVAETLQGLGLHFLVIELDQRQVDQAKQDGMPVVFGDASHETVLEAAHLRTASLLLVTAPSVVVARAIVVQAQKLNPSIDIVVRVHDLDVVPSFHALHVTEVVLPEFEAGLEMTRQALVHLGVPAPEIQRHTEESRQRVFGHLLATPDYKSLAQLRFAEQQFDLQWVRIEADSPFVATSIIEADIRKETGASVVGVIRGEQLHTNPEATFRFKGGDLVAIIGTERARAAFQEASWPFED